MKSKMYRGIYEEELLAWVIYEETLGTSYEKTEVSTAEAKFAVSNRAYQFSKKQISEIQRGIYGSRVNEDRRNGSRNQEELDGEQDMQRIQQKMKLLNHTILYVQRLPVIERLKRLVDNKPEEQFSLMGDYRRQMQLETKREIMARLSGEVYAMVKDEDEPEGMHKQSKQSQWQRKHKYSTNNTT